MPSFKTRSKPNSFNASLIIELARDIDTESWWFYGKEAISNHLHGFLSRPCHLFAAKIYGNTLGGVEWFTL